VLTWEICAVKLNIIGVFLFIASTNLFAQDLSNNTYPKGSEELYDQYTKAIGKSGRLFNGHEYSFEDFQNGGHPFSGRKMFHSERLIYDGFTYESVEIMYDIYRDQIVMAHNDENGNFARIALYSEKAMAFTLRGNQFIRLEGSGQTPPSGDGFYEILYSDQLVVLAKREKKLRPSSNGGYTFEFYQTDQFYLKKDGFFYHIKSKNDFYKPFSSNKKLMKAYARQSGVNRMNLEYFIIFLADYYDVSQKVNQG